MENSLLFCRTFSNLQSNRTKSVSVDVIDRTDISTSDRRNKAKTRVKYGQVWKRNNDVHFS